MIKGAGRLATSGKTRVPFLAACALGCILLQGCSFIGEHFVTPGSTVTTVSSSPDQIVLAYNHVYDSELPAAKQKGEDYCAQSGKHAKLVGISQRTLDHSWAMFQCE